MEKKRCPNFSAMEINLLKDIVMTKVHIIENKKSDAVTWKAKKNCWEEITTEYNSRSLNPKSAETLRKKWDNMKKNVKDKVTGQRKYALGTGGGPSMPPPNLTTEEEGIFSLITVQATGTESVCDSDYQPDIAMPSPISPSQTSIIFSDETLKNITVDKNKDNFNDTQTISLENIEEDKFNKWSDYTPTTLRSRPSLVSDDVDDKENPFRRYRKRHHSGQLTNKAWTELANKKKDLCALKKEHILRLIAESESRKRYYDLQSQLLELELEKRNKNLPEN